MVDTSSPGPESLARVGERFGEYEVTDILPSRGRLQSFAATYGGGGQPYNLLAVGTADLPERVAARFDANTEKLAKLTHANVAKLFAHGIDQTRQCRWWAYELVQGESLLERTKRLGPLPTKELATIGTHLSNALTQIYGTGLLHLGIKPSAVMLCKEGVAKLAGLGVTDHGTEIDVDSGEAADDPVRYASPEQATGSQNLDTRSDIYSLGATLYYLATGRAPFAGTAVADVPAKHASGQVPWPSDVNADMPTQISRVIAKMMAKDPAERYKTPTELSLDFGIVSQGQEPVIAAQAPSKSTVAPSNKPVKPATAAKRADRDTAKTKIAAPVGKARGRTTAKTKVSPAVQRHGRRTPAGGVPTDAGGGRLDIRWLAAGGGGVIALIVGLVLILSSQGGQTEAPAIAMPVPLVPVVVVDTPVTATDDDGEADAPPADVAADAPSTPSALEDIEGFHKRNPKQFRDVIRRLNALARKTEDKALAAKAQARAGELRRAWDEHSKPLLDSVKPKAEALAAKHDYDGALAAVSTVRPQLSPGVNKDANQLTGLIAERGRAHIAKILDDAWGLAKGGDAQKAREVLASLKEVRYRNVLQQQDKRIKSVLSFVAKTEKAAGLAAAKKARAALEEILTRCDTLIADGAYGQARDLGRTSAGKPAMAAVSRELEGAAAVAASLSKRRAAMIAYAKSKVGTDIAVATTKGSRKGSLKEATDAGMTLLTRMVINGQVRGETTYTVEWKSLTTRESNWFARSWKPQSADDHLAVATMALARDDHEAAEAAIALAPEHAFAPRLSAKVEAIKLAKSNKDAGLAWQMVERRAKQKEFTLKAVRELDALIASFEKNHAGTDLMESHAVELASIKRTNRQRLIGAGLVEGATEFEGRRYKLYPYVMRWDQARDFCASLGGHLVTIGSAQENAFVGQLAKKRDVGLWLGFSMATGGKWIDGSPLSYENWRQPSRKVWKGRPHAAVAGDTHTWIQHDGYGISFVLCEWEPPPRLLKPAPSADESPYALPLGHKRSVLYEENFEGADPKWMRGTPVKNTRGGGTCVSAGRAPEKWNSSHNTHKWWGDPPRLNTKSRVTVRYRMDGDVSHVTLNLTISPPGGDKDARNSCRLHLPRSVSWATADFEFSQLQKAQKDEAIDEATAFDLNVIGFTSGRRDQKGGLFIDDVAIYDVVKGD